MRMHAAAAAGSAFVAGLAATSWTALTLAEFGRFGPVLPLLVFPVTAIAVFRLLSRGDGPEPGRAVAPEEWAAVAIACSTLLLTLPADEILLGGQDPSVYVHTAAAVARQGSLLLDEPDIAALAKGERRLLLNTALGVPQPFTGMWLLRDGRISPQFFHLYPSLMAVAWSLGGVRGALLVNPLLNVAAVLALYALAALLLGRRWALAAALLHACWAAQVRQAKFPTAELLAQLFLLAGAALLLRALREERPPPLLAPLAGAALGMALLARYDTLLFLVPFAVLLVWGMEGAGRTRTVLAALSTTAVFGAQAWLHQKLITPVYHPGGRLLGPALAVVAAALAAGLLLRRTAAWRRFAERVPWRGTALRVAAAAGLCGWVLFAWFVRPGLEEGSLAGGVFVLLAGPPPLPGLALLLIGPESRNMLMLAGVLGSAGAAAAVAGAAVLLVRRRGLFETAWLGASAAVLALLVAVLFHDHYLMWASRRFVPVVLPLASVAIAGAGAQLASARRGSPEFLAAAGAALVAAILALNAADTAAMARTREWPGLISVVRVARALAARRRGGLLPPVGLRRAAAVRLRPARL